MTSVKFVHLSDPHLIAPEVGEQLFTIETGKKFKDVMTRIEYLKLKPDFFIISGDLTEKGQAVDYEYVKKMIRNEEERFGVPILVALGNHDERKAFRSAYLNEHSTKQPYYYMKTINGLRIIVLDSLVEGMLEGEICEEQLNWLKTVLQTDGEKGTIIVIHHPPLQESLRNKEAFYEIINDSSDVIGILSGHMHFDRWFTFGSIPVCVSSGVAFGVNLFVEGPTQIIDTSCFNVIEVKDKQLSATLMTASEPTVTAIEST